MGRNKLNSRGPISNSPTGYGTVTANGYLKVYDYDKRCYVLEHVKIYEEAFGKVRKGYEIHHIDGNKLNNSLDNLTVVTRLEHKRLHGGCTQDGNGTWHKPCKKCGAVLPVTTKYYYFKSNSNRPYSWCKDCTIKYNSESRRIRKYGIGYNDNNNDNN